MMAKPLCINCGCRIEGERVVVGRHRFRHPECEKPSRPDMPARALTPEEREERREDKREERRQDSRVK